MTSSFDLDAVSDYQPILTSLEAPITVAYNSYLGKHVIASRDLRKGEILAVEGRLVGWCNTLADANEGEENVKAHLERWTARNREADEEVVKAECDGKTKSERCSYGCVSTVAIAACLNRLGTSMKALQNSFSKKELDTLPMWSIFESVMRPFERLCGICRSSGLTDAEEQELRQRLGRDCIFTRGEMTNSEGSEEQDVVHCITADLLALREFSDQLSVLPDLCFTPDFIYSLAERLSQNVICYAEASEEDSLERKRGPHRVFGVFVITSLLNHNCSPNVEVVGDPDGISVSLQTLREVGHGEELCISYLEGSEFESMQIEDYPRGASRRAALRRHWHFDCACKKCNDEKDQSNAVNVESSATATTKGESDSMKRLTEDRGNETSVKRVKTEQFCP